MRTLDIKTVLFHLAPAILAFVPMVIWRIGSMSGSMIALTLFSGFVAIARYRSRPYSSWVLLGLLASACLSAAVLCYGAQQVSNTPGGSVPELDTPYQWFFFTNACVFCLALLVPIWIKRSQRRRASSHPV